MTVLHKIAAFVRLGRYLFLGGGFVMYGLGAAIAHYVGVHIDWTVYAWGQVIVTATQLMVHYANDYFDLSADLANPRPTHWSGGSRVLAGGELPPRVALITALCLGAFAVVASVALAVVAQPDPLALLLLLAGIGLSWFYSAPPVRLLSRGIGELSASLVVSVLTPLVAFTLQARRMDTLPLLALLPLFFLQINMLLAVAMPDVEGDAAAGKRTLVVRIGRRQAARLYALMAVLAYLSLPLLVNLPLLVAAALLPGLPIGMWLSWRMWQCSAMRPTCQYWNLLEFLSIALLMGSAILEIVAFLALSI